MSTDSSRKAAGTVARLAARQIDADRRRTSRFAGLFERKASRMRASPLAFLRGALPMFHEVLAERPELLRDVRDAAAGEGWIAGDLHLENFGAYRADEHTFDDHARARDRVVFDLNDFDEAVVAPWHVEVLRLTTSVLLAGRTVAASGPQTIELARALLDAYVSTACSHGKMPAPPRPVEELVQQVRARTRKQLLDARTELVRGGGRRFVRGERYRDLERDTLKAVPEAFARYVAALPEDVRPSAEQSEIVDAAFRVAGTGSLGCLRIAVLARGKGGAEGGWIFDLKEEDDADRVVTAMRTCLEHPPRQTGTTTLGRAPMLVRRLAPQEDKLAFARIARGDLAATVAYLGACAGRAHARGATKRPKGAWSKVEREAILESAVELAALHEGAYLAMCRSPS